MRSDEIRSDENTNAHLNGLPTMKQLRPLPFYILNRNATLCPARRCRYYSTTQLPNLPTIPCCQVNHVNLSYRL